MYESNCTYQLPNVGVIYPPTNKTFDPNEIKCERILERVSAYYESGVDELRSKTRQQSVLIPRQVAMYFCKKRTKASLYLIGKVCGMKDHATVINAVRSVERMMLTNYKGVTDDVIALTNVI